MAEKVLKGVLQVFPESVDYIKEAAGPADAPAGAPVDAPVDAPADAFADVPADTPAPVPSTYKSKSPFNFSMAGITNEGVYGQENQDTFFVWKSGVEGTFVLGVLDGHGRKMGKFASLSATTFFKNTLAADFQRDGLAELRTTPKQYITKLFIAAHQAVSTMFIELYHKASKIKILL